MCTLKLGKQLVVSDKSWGVGLGNAAIHALCNAKLYINLSVCLLASLSRGNIFTIKL